MLIIWNEVLRSI